MSEEINEKIKEILIDEEFRLTYLFFMHKVKQNLLLNVYQSGLFAKEVRLFDDVG